MVAGLPCTPGGHSYHSCAAPELAVLLAGARAGRRRPSTVKVIGPPAPEPAPSKRRSIAAWVLTGGTLVPTIAMPVSLTGRLWAERVVETSPEAYDAVVLHAGSWDATYTAYNASGFEDGRRAEVSTWRGATGLSEGPSHCQPVLQPPRVSSICHDGGVVYGPWQPQTAGPAPEARPSLNRRACLPYGGLPPCRAPTALLCPDHDATLPRPKLLPQP